MEKYDVIIIGAGPGGLNCAYHLRNSGKKVLVLEKNEGIGIKVCAGGIQESAVKYLNISNELLEYCFKKIIFNSLFFRTVVELRDPVYMIDRKVLGNWQIKMLENSDIEIRKNVKVDRVKNNSIVTDAGEEIGFEYLVGADGTNSIVRKHLNLNSEKIGIGMHYLVKDKNFNQLKIVPNSILFPSWYGWVFPHKEYASIGCGGDVKLFSAQKLKTNLEKWLSKNDIKFSNSEFQACPINFDYRGYGLGNIFLAGEAAGLVSGLTGEGIYSALISGEEIARSIIDKNYISEKMKKIIKAKKKQENFLKLTINSGIFRIFLIEIVVFLAKIKFLARKGEKSLHLVDF